MKKKEKKQEGKSFAGALKNDLLSTMLQMAVPLYVLKLKEKGGPDKDDMAKAQKWSDVAIISHGYCQICYDRQIEELVLEDRAKGVRWVEKSPMGDIQEDSGQASSVSPAVED